MIRVLDQFVSMDGSRRGSSAFKNPDRLPHHRVLQSQGLHLPAQLLHTAGVWRVFIPSHGQSSAAFLEMSVGPRVHARRQAARRCGSGPRSSRTRARPQSGLQRIRHPVSSRGRTVMGVGTHPQPHRPSRGHARHRADRAHPHTLNEMQIADAGPHPLRMHHRLQSERRNVQLIVRTSAPIELDCPGVIPEMFNNRVKTSAYSVPSNASISYAFIKLCYSELSHASTAYYSCSESSRAFKSSHRITVVTVSAAFLNDRG